MEKPLTLTVTAKGQVTLRRAVLRHLGVAPGGRVVVELDGSGGATLRRAAPPPDPSGALDAFFDALPPPPRRAASVPPEAMAAIAAEGWAGRALPRRRR